MRSVEIKKNVQKKSHITVPLIPLIGDINSQW